MEDRVKAWLTQAFRCCFPTSNNENDQTVSRNDESVDAAIAASTSAQPQRGPFLVLPSSTTEGPQQVEQSGQEAARTSWVSSEGPVPSEHGVLSPPLSRVGGRLPRSSNDPGQPPSEPETPNASISNPIYEMSDKRPTRGITTESAKSALEDLMLSTRSFLEENRGAHRTIVKKAQAITAAMVPLMQALTNEEARPSAYAYWLDGKPVAVAVASEFIGPDHLYLDGMVSHPGVKNAAPALLEEILRSAGPQAEIRLTSFHGAASAYRKLGFRPVDEVKFNTQSLPDYDALFLNRERDAEVQESPELLNDLEHYLKMHLRPHDSELWEFHEGSWRYAGGGKKHLTSIRAS